MLHYRQINIFKENRQDHGDPALLKLNMKNIVDHSVVFTDTEFKMLDGLTENIDIPESGCWVKFKSEGYFEGGDITGQPAHSAIFIFRDENGEEYYVHRKNTWHPVSIVSKSSLFEDHRKSLEESGYDIKDEKTPTINPTPEYRRRK